MANPVEPITAQGAYAITPSDTTVYTRMFSGLFVGGAGNVRVRTANGDDVTFTGVLAGQVLPIKGDMVYATSTTATNIVGMTY